MFSAGFSQEISDALKGMGHTVHTVDSLSIVNTVLKVKDNIEAVADERKKGSGAALFK